MTRSAATLLFALAATPALAQPVALAEKVAVGDRARCSVELDLKGELIFEVEGKKESARVEAKARHVFAERVLAVRDGMPASTARYYASAVASAAVGGDRIQHELPADRRFVVARRNPDGLFCFAPAGPLTRDELDLATEHFNPQCLAGLLPGRAVNVGDSWQVSDPAAQAACLFDAVAKAQLVGKLTAVKDGLATFTVEGSAEGFENGAKVTVAVSATGTFDVTAGRVVALAWKQKDDRESGPVSPASQVEATVTLKRDTASELPKELSDAAVEKLPVGGVPNAMTDLRYADPKGRYTLAHPREWHVTGQTDSHLVLRLLDRGEYAAQATVTVWKRAMPGKHSSADEFKKAANDAPGWTPSKVLADEEVPVDGGRWLYRVVAEGKMDQLPVVQSFYLLAGPQGDQVAVTVAARPDRVKAVGTRDLELVKAIEFGKK